MLSELPFCQSASHIIWYERKVVQRQILLISQVFNQQVGRELESETAAAPLSKRPQLKLAKWVKAVALSLQTVH
jgi:hypothetical protein